MKHGQRRAPRGWAGHRAKRTGRGQDGRARQWQQPGRDSAAAPPGGVRGRRSARLAADRRRRQGRRRGVLVAVAASAGVLAVAAVVWLVDLGPSADPQLEQHALPLTRSDTRALLLVRHDEGGGPARSLTLLATGPRQGQALVLFLPVGALVDIPGVGMDRLGLTHQYGSSALAQATVENVLGVAVDHTAAVSDRGLGAFLGRLDGMRLEVPRRLVRRNADGTADVRFEPGAQFLDGPRLAEYWSFRDASEDELATFSRQQRVLEGLLSAAADPEARADLVGDGAPQLDTSAEAAWLDELLSRLADAYDDQRLRFALLPVEPFGGEGPDGGSTYRVREPALAELVDGVVSATMARSDEQVMRVQVLNGVGAPGVGQQVDRRLDRGRFRIVVTDNARHFNFTETQILVYDERPATLAAAKRVQEVLGVGSIQVSRQPQSVVDLTIVVGADFLDDSAPAEEDGSGS